MISKELAGRIGLDEGVRIMAAEDLPEVLEIERRAYAFPWTEGIFKDCLRVGYPAWVYGENGRIQGYGILSVAADEGHILNLCVAPEYQRRGVGRRLLRALLLTAERLDVNTLFLEVRVSNHAAIALYRKFGFNEIGVRRQYYPARKGREDAMVLARHLPPKRKNPGR